MRGGAAGAALAMRVALGVVAAFGAGVFDGAMALAFKVFAVSRAALRSVAGASISDAGISGAVISDVALVGDDAVAKPGGWLRPAAGMSTGVAEWVEAVTDAFSAVRATAASPCVASLVRISQSASAKLATPTMPTAPKAPSAQRGHAPLLCAGSAGFGMLANNSGASLRRRAASDLRKASRMIDIVHSLAATSRARASDGPVVRVASANSVSARTRPSPGKP
jgi:hypothetical protein